MVNWWLIDGSLVLHWWLSGGTTDRLIGGYHTVDGKKSYTRWDGRYPIIYKVLYIPAGYV